MYENDENKLYVISSACSAVRIVSDYFGTEYNYDFLTIDPQGANLIYHGGPTWGTDIYIDVVIEKSDFEITFTADGAWPDTGYKLRWFCNG